MSDIESNDESLIEDENVDLEDLEDVEDVGLDELTGSFLAVREEANVVNEVVVVGKKGRGKGKEYEEVATFPDAKSAAAAMKGEVNGQLWSSRQLLPSEEGDKQFYSCKNYHECPKMAYALRHCDRADTSIWVATCEHDHKPEHRVYCWAHVLRAIDNSLNGVKNLPTREAIRQDIIHFHHYVQIESFVIVMRLMIEKWRLLYADNAQVINFVDNYFVGQWASLKRMGWFDHYCDWVPITNNALEGTNRYVKKDGTLRKRYGLREFFHLMETGFVRDWSLERTSQLNGKIFNDKPQINLPDYTTACQWNSLGKSVKKYTYNDQILYCTQSSDKKITISTADCDAYFSKLRACDWSSYDSFVKHSTRTIHFVTVNDTNWQMSKCSCFYWCKYYTCKHMLAVCQRLECFDFPENAKNVPIGANRKRGRPKNTVSALKYQPDEFVTQEYVYSSTESEISEPENDVPTRKGTKRKELASTADEASEDDFDIFDNAKVLTACTAAMLNRVKVPQSASATPKPKPRAQKTTAASTPKASKTSVKKSATTTASTSKKQQATVEKQAPAKTLSKSVVNSAKNTDEPELTTSKRQRKAPIKFSN